MKTTVVRAISATIQAIENCKKSNNQGWLDKHEAKLNVLVENYLPHGSGFDSGTQIILEKCNQHKLVFQCDFHHMDDMGGYVGWSFHTVVVTPSFSGCDIRITGRNRRDIKSYIGEEFSYRINQEIDTENL